MAADLSRALALLERQTGRRAPFADALRDVETARPGSSTLDAAIERAIGEGGGETPNATVGNPGPDVTMATPANVANMFGFNSNTPGAFSNAPGGRIGSAVSTLATLFSAPPMVGPMVNVGARAISMANAVRAAEESLRAEQPPDFLTLDMASRGPSASQIAATLASMNLSPNAQAAIMGSLPGGTNPAAQIAQHAAAPFGRGSDEPDAAIATESASQPGTQAAAIAAMAEAANEAALADAPSAPGGSGGPGPGDGSDSGTGVGEFRRGGTVPRTGRALVHKNEEVVRASEAQRPGVRPLLKAINKPGESDIERRLADFERRHGNEPI